MGIDLGTHNGTSVGPGRGLQLSEDSPTPGRILFIGHHGAYEVSKMLAGSRTKYEDTQQHSQPAASLPV